MTKNNNDPIKKLNKPTFIEKSMDFWFYNQHTVKVLRFGILGVTVLIWILMPGLIVKMFWNFKIYASFGSLLIGIILTYTFFGTLMALNNVNKLLKGFKVENIKKNPGKHKFISGKK